MALGFVPAGTETVGVGRTPTELRVIRKTLTWWSRQNCFGLGSGLLVRDTEIGYRPGALGTAGGSREHWSCWGSSAQGRRALDNGSVAMGP